MLDSLSDFGLGLVLGLVFVLVAIRIAVITGMNDVPSGWKDHGRPTPQLGGAAILAATVVALLLKGVNAPQWELLVAALGLFAVGTADDRLTLRATSRLIAQFASGVLAWFAGIGWSITGVDAIDFALSVIWVMTLINAYNFLDLMDGVAGATIAVTLIAISAIAAIADVDRVITPALVASGACAAFLVFNLARPSRIFLGNGGTMPIGFLISVAAMATLRDEPAGIAIAAAVLIAAVPAGDLVHRVLLRLKQGRPVLMAGPDSNANRLHARVGSARAVALLFAAAEGALGAAALLIVSRS